MAVVNPTVIGRVGRAAAKEQTGTGSALLSATIRPVAGDEFPYISHSITYNANRRERIDKRDTRSLVERIEGRREVDWEVETYTIPKTTAPHTNGLDIDILLGNALGASTSRTSPGNHREYACSDTQTEFVPFTLVFEQDGERMDVLTGCVVNEVTFTWQEGEEPKWRFSGMAFKHSVAGRGTLDAATTSASPTITLQPGESALYQVGSIIQVGAATGTSGFLVIGTFEEPNGVAGLTDGQLELGENVGSIEADDSVVQPFFGGSDISSDSPASEIAGEFDLIDFADDGTHTPFAAATGVDGNDIDFSGFEWTLSNNIQRLNKPGQQEVLDFSFGRRSVTGTLTMFGKRDSLLTVHRAKLTGTTDINPVGFHFAVGPGTFETASNVEFTFPKAELDYNFEVPDGSSDDIASAPLAFTAYAAKQNPDDAEAFELKIRAF